MPEYWALTFVIYVFAIQLLIDYAGEGREA